MCMIYCRCAICLSCGSNDPGFNCMWQKSFTECGPCASHTTCPSCLEPYNEGDLIIQCVQCERFVLRSISINISAAHSYCLLLLDFWTLSSVWYCKKNTVFQELDVSILKWKGGEYLHSEIIGTINFLMLLENIKQDHFISPLSWKAIPNKAPVLFCNFLHWLYLQFWFQNYLWLAVSTYL